MPIVFTELAALLEALSPRLTAPAIIGVDGWTGVGKTTLAKALANALDGSSYDLDCALNRNMKRYTSALRLAEVSEALQRPERPLFVSGICLRQVLANVGHSATAHIYVKRMATWGWADEDELKGSIPEVPGASGERVREELRRYHQEWSPHVRADFEFRWIG